MNKQKILLVGPYPPPHGGISTHVAELERQWRDAGVRCRVLDTGRVGMRFFAGVVRFACAGWTLHVHTNGHNRKSWVLAGICGLVGRSPVLTLHSGMAPAYLLGAGGRLGNPPQAGSLPHNGDGLPYWICKSFKRIVCVNAAIRDALVAIGVPEKKLEIKPAFIEPQRGEFPLNPLLRAWMGRHSPVFSTTLFFRPEYGFEFLVSALAKLRRTHPSLGCVVMGSGEEQGNAERLVRESGLQDNIFFAGDVSHESCLAVMSRSDVFLRPTFADGDSVSVREALALGVPVVASRVGTRPDDAILFEAGDREDLCARVEQALKQHVIA
ncbi:MAG: glycosyltransferase [Bryobacterales bacterium]|nr:glycosyltransferase [Bryobacterales bacterium]